MIDSLRSPATMAWLTLVTATGTSWLLCQSGPSARLGATAAVLIAAFKARIVIGHFMELGWWPRPWRIAFEVWVAVVTGIILGGYWLTEI